MAEHGPIVSLDALATQVPDGALLAVPPDYSGVAMEATRALIRRGVKRLHLVAVPTSGLQTELLIGAGCVETIEAAAITLGEAGPAPRFSAAVKSGAVHIRDATCPAIHAAFQAAEKGIPFMPLRGIIGTDILRHRTDWLTIQNPLAEGDDPIVLLPAIQPDIALFHVPLADREGNVWIGRRRELVTMAHAAKRSLVTAETIQEQSLLEDERLAAGVIPALYVSAVAEAEHGAWPIGLEGRYEPDTAHIADYARTARSEDGFRAYLAQHVLAGRRAA